MDLELRVEHLERQIRWMKATILAVVVIAVAMSQFRNTKDFEAFRDDIVARLQARLQKFQESLNGEIQSKRFLLVDDEGNARGVWTAEENQCLFTLLDKDRKPLLAIVATEESRGIEIFDAKGRSYVSLSADEHAGSLLIRSPDSGSPAHALLRVGATGPRFTMKDNAGNEQPVVPW